MNATWAMLAGLAMLQVGVDIAPHADAGPPPRWLSRPTAAQLIKVYPDKALYASKSGHVVMHCSVTPEGKLSDCKITQETPKGFGFGAAVLSLVPLYRLEPVTAGGTAASDGTVDIPVDFRI
jgi:protein TonB